MEKLLNGKNALITGGAGEMASTIARTLAKEGAGIVLVDLNAEAVKRVAQQIGEECGVPAVGYAYNLCDFATHADFIDQVEKEFGEIQILVNVAGITNTITYRDITEADWDKMMSINLKAPFFFTRELFFRMQERKEGRIVNLGSISGERGAKYAGPHYSISKAGLICFTKVLAKLAGASGVTVNTVSPGIIASRMTNDLGSQVYSYDVPMDRMGTPQEVADAILYLVSPLASYVTGQNLSVNGGQSMR